MDFVNAPLIIGATDGSGTRPVARTCQQLGIYMGLRLNASLDARDFIPFYDKWVNDMLSRSDSALSEEQSSRMSEHFFDSIQRHRNGIPDQSAPWGWKNARSIYLVPFFRVLYPNMKFIHVVRDGRDIAFLKDSQRLLQHTRTFFDTQYDALLLPYRLMLLWKATNLTMASFGESEMPGNYLRIRYEDLCENPSGIIRRLLRFLNVQNGDVSKLADEVKRSDSIGRWHMFPIDLVGQLEELGREALGKFGYM